MAVGMNWERLTSERRGAVMHYFASVYGCRPELAFTLARKSVNALELNKDDTQEMTSVMMCACGCGQVSSANPKYAPRKYVEGHRPTRRIPDKSVVLLSPEDEDLRSRRWTLSPDGYVISSGPLHREIAARMLGRPLIGNAKGETVDHINENKLDNRRENLRVCTLAENKQNATKPLRYKKSGLPRGVFHHATHPGWFTVYTSRTRDGVRKTLYLGSYQSLEDAVAAFERYKRERTAYIPMEERPA